MRCGSAAQTHACCTPPETAAPAPRVRRYVETIKLAAVQYIALFIPIGAILGCLHGALFRYGVLSARVHHPVKEHRW